MSNKVYDLVNVANDIGAIGALCGVFARDFTVYVAQRRVKQTHMIGSDEQQKSLSQLNFYVTVSPVKYRTSSLSLQIADFHWNCVLACRSLSASVNMRDALFIYLFIPVNHF